MSEFVVIGCKLPHGIILQDPADKTKTVAVKGAKSTNIIGGFGLTEGVPKDFWDRWKEANKALSFVKECLIWAYGKEGDAERKGEELRDKKHGMEPIDPKGDPRTPKIVATDKESLEAQR